MSSSVEVNQKLVLGAAMRLARLNHRPLLTLKEVGYDPRAPRSWSHAHLSKVERGIEIPKEDLVRWYETICEVSPGYLLELLHSLDSDSQTADPTHGRSESFSLDRMELQALFNRSSPEVRVVADLITTAEKADSFALLLDGRDEEYPLKHKGPRILHGAERSEVEWSSTSASSVRFYFGREFAKGDWHRIHISETAPTFCMTGKRNLTLSSKRSEVRDAIISVTFPEGQRPNCCLIDGMMPEEVNAHFGTKAPIRTKRLAECEVLEIDSTGTVQVRFRSILPGLRYGIGWY
jgi:hypothetical protein